LGITDPWYVAALDLDPPAKPLEIRIDFRRGGTFACASCAAAGRNEHDTADHRCRHRDFFQFRTGLVTPTPRVDCPRSGVHPVADP
jgi:transposase